MTKLIVITGVSKGLGLAMTEKFIELGDGVLGCARSLDRHLKWRDSMRNLARPIILQQWT